MIGSTWEELPMTTRNPVTSDDLRVVAAWTHDLLSTAAEADWTVPAFRMRWSCRRTLDHMLDCLAWYAHDIAGEVTGIEGAARAGTPRLKLTDLLASIRPLAEVLSLVCDGKPVTARGWHPYGFGDPEGFLAMGTIETLTHTWDIGIGLGLDVGIPPEIEAVAGRVVDRLLVDVLDAATRFDALLMATGRLEREDGTRPTRWRWYTAPLHERQGSPVG